jgi:glycosyltransferase involved in cell wall biosynthesis
MMPAAKRASGRPAAVLLMARTLGLGGSERQLAETAKTLDRDRFAPHVGCFHADGFRAGELRAAGIPVVEFPITSFIRPSMLPQLLAFGRYIERHDIQLVHTFDVPLNLFGVPAGRLFRVPRVISSQRAHRELTPGLHHRLLRITDRLVDCIVVNSESVRRDLIEDDHVPPSRIRLCYNGIDIDRFRPEPRKPGGTLVVGVVCALRPEKNLETLIQAFSKLDQSLSAQLLIVGSGPEEAKLHAVAAGLALNGQAGFEPATNDVASWLRKIDVFVLPSLSEAFSNSLMEAMACGCCVIASRVGGNPELVSDGETGLLFNPGDPEDLARCLNRALRDVGLRAQLGAAGRCRIETEFTLAQAAGRMGEIYSAVLAGK